MIQPLCSGPRHASVQFMFSKGKMCKFSSTFMQQSRRAYSRLLNKLFLYKIRAKVIMIIFHSCCYLRYRLLISPYSFYLRDLTVQCVSVLSMNSLTLVFSHLWQKHDLKFVTMLGPLNVGLSIASVQMLLLRSS